MSYFQFSFQRRREKKAIGSQSKNTGNEAREVLALLVICQKSGAGFYSQSLTSSYKKLTCIQKRQTPESFL